MCDITVRGHEGGNVVINCPSQKGYESHIKYLLKGKYKGRVDVIRSDGQAEWTHRGRISLQNKKDRNIFTVTIRNLTLEDAGTYGCGVDIWFWIDIYTTVKLTVVSNHNATTRMLSNTTESERPTHIQSDQMSPTSSGHLANLSWGLVVAVVIFALLVVTFRLMKRKTVTKWNFIPSLALPTPLSGNITTDSCVYSEIQTTSPHATDGPNQSDQRSSPALTSIYALATHPAPDQHPASAEASNQLPQPTTSNMQAANQLSQPTSSNMHTTNQLPQPTSSNRQAANHFPTTASDDIYYLATNPMPALHSCTTSATNQHCESGPATAATDSDDIYSLATNPTPSPQTGASAYSATNQQIELDPANYSNKISANENTDGSEYATVVFSD
ncbi:CMRF35-like molecule 1 [Alosa alosa]|uniref:CMRF35-like molecule 1 n=1 Tax=Alosa alosa TaxID=278164 RepID=UPI0020151726|nr:CMRF35-like molecule 1 [Alosa alosa]